MLTKEELHRQDLERLKQFRYMDDDFMNVCLEDNIEGVELILRIVLEREDITVKSVRTQEPLKNLRGRSATLDVHAVDSTKKEYDIEIQRADSGTGAKRARHNSSLLDSHILKAGEDTKDMPDSYVIFITENDVMKGNQAVYPVERYITIGEKQVLFNDGSHILYVNGQYRGNDNIGKLMHDFSCANPEDMNYKILAEKAMYFKQDEKGVVAMCKMLEDMRNEAALDNARETAKRLIRMGKMTIEEIASCLPDLSMDELKKLEAEVMQLA